VSRLSVDVEWRFHGLRTVILENSFLRAVILPEIGARVYQLTYKPRDLELIWNHPRIKPSIVPFGSRYDDVWCGGWDETLPNSDAGVIDGESYPDHGEVWAEPWDFETSVEPNCVSARFTCRTRISDLWIEKVFSLRADEPKLRISYFMRNDSGHSVPVLWNLHAAMAISVHHSVHFPPMNVNLEPSAPGTLGDALPLFRWPMADTPNGSLDLRRVPDSREQKLHFFYGSDFSEGWCGITDSRSTLAYGFSFDPTVFRNCWLFASYGGWRNLNVAVLEPSTGYPCKIEQATERQTCLRLAPGEQVKTSIIFSVNEGISSIRSISPDGAIS
jgi:hypothetical protein